MFTTRIRPILFRHPISTASGLGAALTPYEAADYVFDRLAAESVGLRAGFRVVRTSLHQLRIPRLLTDPSSGWVAEGAEITASDATGDSILSTPQKLAALSIITNETIRDSTPALLDLYGDQMNRDLSLNLDLGFFEGTGTAPQIRGLKNVAGITSVSMGANGAQITNLDPWADAIGALAESNAEATAIFMHARDWKAISKIKETTGSNKPVMVNETVGPTGKISRSIYGIPVFLTTRIATNEVQGTSGAVCTSSYVVQADQVVVVLREDVDITVNPYRLSHEDKTEVKATLRADLIVPNPAAVVRILGIKP